MTIFFMFLYYYSFINSIEICAQNYEKKCKDGKEKHIKFVKLAVKTAFNYEKRWI